MADRTQLKVSENNEVDRDDPFAELTRIMGFDPRVPVTRSEAEALRSLSAPAPVVDDFEIDLEKELMGDFSFDEEPITLVAANEEMAPETAAWQPAEEPAPVEADLPELDDFDVGAFDAAMQDWSAETAQPAEASAPEALAEAEPVAAAQEIAGEDEFELDLAEDEAGEPVEAALDPAVETEAAPAETLTEAALASSFDEAMAEVDMDFRAVAKLYAGESAQEATAPVAADADVEDEPQAFDVEASLEDELNALLGKSVAQGTAAPVESVVPAAADDLPEFDWDAEISVVDVADGTPEEASADAAFGEYTAYEEEDERLVEAAPVAETPADAAFFDERAFEATFAEGLDDSLPEDDASRFEDEEADYVAPQAAQPDPFEELTRMAAAYRTAPVAPVAYEAVEHPVEAELPVEADYEPISYSETAYEADTAYDDADYRDDGAAASVTAPAAYSEMPDIETVDVPESAVALADDLDLPELRFEEDAPAPTAYDDLDAEFASLLNEMNAVEAPAPAAAYQPPRDAWLDRSRAEPVVVPSYAAPVAAPAYASAAAPTSYAATQPVEVADDIDLGEIDFNFDDQAFDAAMARHEAMDDHHAAPLGDSYDAELEDELAMPAAHQPMQQPSNRGLWVAALVGGVALLGGIGAFALSFGDGAGTDAPALVKADTSPIKVRPENPGGTVVPNQEGKVYESVARTATPAEPPRQEKLVTTVEEPVEVKVEDEIPAPEARVVELTPETADPAVAPKGEDRIEQVIDGASEEAAAPVAAVTPRKVRTMVVKPDGSLVPADMPTPAPAVEANNAGADAAPLSPPPVEPSQELPPVAAAPAAPAEAPVEQPAVAALDSATPASVPIAPARPADQPVDVVGEVKPDQVAAIDTTATATAATTGAWSMQIASQPSEAAAQSTYQDLARRYGAVLGGRSVNIVKAEIAGKGTFWRVRVPAETRNDAVNLCNSYKAAGGNCFVSR